MIPTQAGPETICECSHWYEEHDEEHCEGCEVGGHIDPDHTFVFDPEQSTPDAIADRGGDPDYWPAWVKAALR